MTETLHPSIRASRVRIPRSRGALSGLLLVILGAWAGVVAFIAPYFDLAYTPAPNSAWYWTAARGYLEVAPGAAAFLGGLLLLASASRATTSAGGWLAALGGSWLIVGPSLAAFAGIGLGVPDPTSSLGARAGEQLLFFYGVGAAILFLAAGALGRLSVHSVRDVRAAERRAAEEEAVIAEQRRLAEERALHERAERDRAATAAVPTATATTPAGTTTTPPATGTPATATATPAAAEPIDGTRRADQPTMAYPAAPPARPVDGGGRHEQPYAPDEESDAGEHHWWSRHHRRVGSAP